MYLMCECFMYMYEQIFVNHLWAVPMEAKEGIRYPETGFIDGCDPPLVWWEVECVF